MADFLSRVTPIVLCYNEQNNIGRALSSLQWAREVVVVDSFSTDETVAVISGFENARLFQRVFDTHAKQWNFGIQHVDTDWVLALDADYVPSDELITEMSRLSYPSDFCAYAVGFTMCVLGEPIVSGVMPPRLILFDKNRCTYYDDGHTQRLRAKGAVSRLRGRIYHDDRKPLDRFLWSQGRYSRLEADKISAAGRRGRTLKSRIRQFTVLSPFLIFIYVLICRVGFLDGRRGVHYALQRLVAESVIKMRLLEMDIEADRRCMRR